MKIESLADFSIYNYAFSGLVSDAVHLTFGCGLLTFSLFVMGASRKKPDGDYTYG
jgi:divalent metal cation (Fe/Co/Zn/Cd) transporter